MDPKSNVITHDLPFIAKQGCIPESTLEKQSKELRRLDIITSEPRFKNSSLRYPNPLFFSQHYGPKNKERLLVPRRLFLVDNLTFYEAILLTYYRYRCIRKNENPYKLSYCCEMIKEIYQNLGFSISTWKRAKAELQKRGLIESELTPKGNSAVWIPGFQPLSKPWKKFTDFTESE